MRYLILLTLLTGCNVRSPENLKALDRYNEACARECAPRVAEKIKRNDWGLVSTCSCVVGDSE